MLKTYAENKAYPIWYSCHTSSDDQEPHIFFFLKEGASQKEESSAQKCLNWTLARTNVALAETESEKKATLGRKNEL